MWPESLALGAATIYVLNALLYTAPDAAMWNPMTTHVQMREVDEDDPGYLSDEEPVWEDLDMQPTGLEQGLFFFGQLVNDNGFFRLSRHHIIPMDDIVRLYGMEDLFALRARFQAAGVVTQRVIPNASRRNNRMVMTRRFTSSRHEPAPVLNFGIDDQDVEMALGVDISGPDVEAEGVREAEPNSMNERLSKIWYQMLFDVMRKAPNPSSVHLPSFAETTPTEQTEIEETFYKTHELPFRLARCKRVTLEYWDNDMFNRFFPPQGSAIAARLQNFRSCQYFTDFTALMGYVTREHSVTIRNALKMKWQQLYWMPLPSSDRMWNTRQAMTGHHFVLPVTCAAPAPQIALNPRFCAEGQAVATLRGAVDQYPA